MCVCRVTPPRSQTTNYKKKKTYWLIDNIDSTTFVLIAIRVPCIYCWPKSPAWFTSAKPTRRCFGPARGSRPYAAVRRRAARWRRLLVPQTAAGCRCDAADKNRLPCQLMAKVLFEKTWEWLACDLVRDLFIYFIFLISILLKRKSCTPCFSYEIVSFKMTHVSCNARSFMMMTAIRV